MRWSAVLGWGVGLWVATGCEAVWGGSNPGPLFLLALSAGLVHGPAAGLGIGFAAGLGSAVLCGRDLLPLVLCGMAGGALAGLVPRWFSARNVLIGVLLAFLTTTVLNLAWMLPLHLPAGRLLRTAASHGGMQALWMFAIYGIVLIVSARFTQGRSWEE
jgi:hypothetical protein